MEKSEDKFGLDRIVFFSDAVIAIAITLLVIEIKIPEIEKQLVNSTLTHHILEMWSEYLGYVVSFMVISGYWMQHHKIFRNINNYNYKLIYINTLFLMCIAFMPFTTNLMFNYPAQLISVIMYAGLVTLIGLLILWLWLYAIKHNLVWDTLEKSDIKPITRGLLITPIVFLGSIFIALFNPLLAMYSWIILLPIYLFGGASNRKKQK